MHMPWQKNTSVTCNKHVTFFKALPLSWGYFRGLKGKEKLACSMQECSKCLSVLKVLGMMKLCKIMFSAFLEKMCAPEK